MRCSSCGIENDDGRKFCAECGTRLAASCPACGAANASTAKFCGECGTRIAGTPGSEASAGAAGASTDRPLATAERRLVSVLFADLVGFTALSEGNDVEAVRDLLTKYFEVAAETVSRYGGVVEKFIGDAVMAVWGAPIAHEDDPERAVRAALDLVDGVRRLGLDAGLALEARAGVLTGEAAVTLGAQGHGMVAGDLVNTASRLQAAAPPGTVLVGDATRRATERAIVFEPAGDQQLKGKSAPVRAFVAREVIARRGGAGRGDALEPPFVGRDEELHLLKEQLHATGREGKARLVSVIGQGGIGKTRLAWELLKYVDGVVEDVYWHQGRSPAYGEGVTFWALAEMVRERAAIAESDDPAIAREKLAASTAEYVRDPADRAWIGPRLAALLGLADAPPGDRQELFAAWRTFFERIADRGVVVMVFEDLEWADAGLIDFIEHLLDGARARPILVLTLARPELLERHPGWGSGQRALTAIHLEPLPEVAMRDLLMRLAPGLPQPLVGRVVSRAEGIPLYAVETLRMLIDDGRVTPVDGTFEVAGDLERLDVPPTLHALIAARLDGLEPAERTLLQDAAVLGQTFTVPALVAISEPDEPALEPLLRSLVRKDLLTRDDDPRSPERGQYGFVQSLIREVAYATLAKRDRRTRHLAAARHFESLGDDALAGALASHYLEAYRASSPGPEAEALASQARIALRAAGQRAAALHSHEQAIGLYEQAMTVTTSAAELAQLTEEAGRSALALARHDDAERRAREALELHRSSGDRTGIARATELVARVLIDSGRASDAIPLLSRCLDGLADLRSDPTIASLTAELARAQMIADDLATAAGTAEEALIVAERHGLTEVLAAALTTRGTALGAQGRVREGTALIRSAAELADEAGITREVLRARANTAYLLARDDPAAAADAARSGLELARRIGDRGWVLFLGSNVVGMASEAGHWDDALALAAELDGDGPPAADAALLEGARAEITAYRGDPTASAAHLRRADELLREIDEPQRRAGAQLSRAECAFAEGRFDDALRGAHDAAAMSPANSYAALQTAARAAFWSRDDAAIADIERSARTEPQRGRVVRAVLAEVVACDAALRGDMKGALPLFREATRLWRETNSPVRLALCLLELTAVAGTSSPEGTAAAEEARELLGRVGATQVFDRLITLAARWSDVATTPARASATILS